MASYWTERVKAAQKNISQIKVKKIETQMRKYYIAARNSVIDSFEATYLKVLNSVADGRTPSPANLYKLDSYWKMEEQLRKELEALGDKQIAFLSEAFKAQYEDIYNNLAIKGEAAYNTAAASNAKKILEEVWCADGKLWSDRVWSNVAQLQTTLNEGLTECLITGKKTTELKNVLQNRFNVSYSNANRIVRTEMAHIENKAALDRYKEAGVKQVKILGSNECETCMKHDGEIVDINIAIEGLTIPIWHPNCTCTIAPIV